MLPFMGTTKAHHKRMLLSASIGVATTVAVSTGCFIPTGNPGPLPFDAGPNHDAGHALHLDGGHPDGGDEDGGTTDAGDEDAGQEDAGELDAGDEDAGS